MTIVHGLKTSHLVSMFILFLVNVVHLKYVSEDCIIKHNELKVINLLQVKVSGKKLKNITLTVTSIKGVPSPSFPMCAVTFPTIHSMNRPIVILEGVSCTFTISHISFNYPRNILMNVCHAYKSLMDMLNTELMPNLCYTNIYIILTLTHKFISF